MPKGKRLLHVLMLLMLLHSICSAATDDSLGLGIKEYRVENFEEALEFLVKARAENPSSSIAAYYLGLTYKNLEKPRLAKDQFLAAATLSPPVLDSYIELAEVLYNIGELDTALQWIEKAEQTSIKPANVLFLKGLVLNKKDRTTDAIKALNRAKELDVSLSQSADFQIAIAQIKMRRYEDAKKSLQTISSMNPNTDIASFAQEYERSLAKTIEASRRWQITAGLAYQYDDNVLLKPTQDIPGVVISNESDSSVIATLGIVSPSLLLGGWSVNGRYNFYNNTHSALHTHDIQNHSLSVVPSYSFGSGVLSFPLTYSHVWLRQQSYMGIITFKPTLQMLVAPGHIIQTSVSYSKQEMIKPSVDPDEDRDASVYTASAGYIHPFNQGRSIFNLAYEFSRQDTDGQNWVNSGHRITAGLLLPFFRDDLTLSLSGDVLLQEFDNVNTVFEIKRRDHVYTGSAGLRWELNKKLSANMLYSHTRADSSIYVYDYKRNMYTVGMEIQF